MLVKPKINRGKLFPPPAKPATIYVQIMGQLLRDDILKLAQLSRLALTDEETDEFASEISEILKYVEQLQEVEIEGIVPTNQVTGLTNVMRDDEEIDYGYNPQDLLKNVPTVEDNQLKVKRMIS
jgi:aspartyl-tRNA(Asn)/glutamyl-tRNA(Gln) amidotransferase subunit C